MADDHLLLIILINSVMCSIIDASCYADMLLTESAISEKSPPSLPLAIVRVLESDKLNKIGLSYKESDNGHGLVAHASSVPPYSTE